MKNYMKSFSFVMMALVLVNCKAGKKGGDNGILILPDDLKPVYSKIEYFAGGWYGPSPNYIMGLTLKIEANGKIQGELDTPACKTQFLAGALDYVDLERLVLSASYTIGTGFMIDGGSETITLGGHSQYYLRDGDLSNGKKIIVKKDADKIRAKVEALAAKAKLACEHEAQTDSVRWEEQAAVEGLETSTSPVLPVNYRTDVKVEFKSTGVTVKGFRKEGFCTRTLKHTVVNPEALIQAANKIEISHNEATCAIFAYVPPSKFTLTAGNTVDFGFEGCWSSPQAFNTDKFKKILDQFFAKIQPKCVYLAD